MVTVVEALALSLPPHRASCYSAHEHRPRLADTQTQCTQQKQRHARHLTQIKHGQVWTTSTEGVPRSATKRLFSALRASFLGVWPKCATP